MDEITKEYCIQEIKRLAETKGRAPLLAEFCEETQIKRYQIQKLFLNFNNLISQSGYEPRVSIIPPLITIEQMWESYANILRQLEHLPTQAEWSFHKFLPNRSTYENKFNCKYSVIPYRFREFTKDKPEYVDVLAYLPTSDGKETTDIITSSVDDFHAYIPPILQSLEETEDSNDFENQVGIAFQLLGFETDHLGQGQGQNPDGVASRPKDNFAILYDAKSHLDGYSISASDRRAAEQYIGDHREALEKDGIKTLFFIFVARSFTSECKKAVQDIREKTNVTTILLTTSALLQLTAGHIQNPYNFDFSKLKALFSKGGQIDEGTIQPFLNEIRE